MKLIIKIILLLSFLTTAFACSKKRPAPIINNSRHFYSKNNKFNNSARTGRTSQIEVVSGDSLYGIAKRHQVTARDLIKYNHLIPPYILHKGDRLIIPAPHYYKVKTGDTLYSISRAHNMKINQLIALNDLKKPYALHAGQKIRISEGGNSFTSNYKPKSYKKPQQKKSNFGFVRNTLDKFSNFSWPVRGKVVSKFGPKSGGLYNDGINIIAKEGSEVKVSKNGVVAYVGNELKGYGNLVIVKHSGGWITAYAHLQYSSVKRGQKLVKGEKIGAVGSTGNVKSPQLYFGLRKGRDAVNPQNYLK